MGGGGGPTKLWGWKAGGGGGIGGGRTTVFKEYDKLVKQVATSKNLSVGQQKDWLDEMKDYTDKRTKASNSRSTALYEAMDIYGQKLKELGPEVDSRKVFIQEQFNALNNSVNSRIQKTKVASFLGATAAKAAL